MHTYIAQYKRLFGVRFYKQAANSIEFVVRSPERGIVQVEEEQEVGKQKQSLDNSSTWAYVS